MSYVIGVAIIAALIAVTALGLTAIRVRRITRQRLYASDAQLTANNAAGSRDHRMVWWLAQAGYRQSNATGLFVAATVAGAIIGLIVSQLYRVLFFGPLLGAVSTIPGATSDALALVLQAAPWILFTLCAGAPALVVRSARRTRVEAVERDLPLALELFATMADAGLGFDAALGKIVQAQGPERPLIAEFVGFQHDLLAGTPRAQALRQLSRRVNTPSLSGFTSALIQAEQVGASMAETLQHQAVDLRQRRREEALLQAQALPVKLVFPLVICFLPGIFVSTLAPVLFQMVEVGSSVLRSSGR